MAAFKASLLHAVYILVQLLTVSIARSIAVYAASFLAVVAIMGKLQCAWSVCWEIRLIFVDERQSAKKQLDCSLMPT